MAIVTFNKKQALNVLLASVERQKPLIFVKVQGLYLMVHGDKDATGNVVEYAKGFNPDVDDLEWSKAILGIQDKWSVLRVHINTKTIKLSVK